MSRNAPAAGSVAPPPVPPRGITAWRRSSFPVDPGFVGVTGESEVQVSNEKPTFTKQNLITMNQMLSNILVWPLCGFALSLAIGCGSEVESPPPLTESVQAEIAAEDAQVESAEMQQRN